MIAFVVRPMRVGISYFGSIVVMNGRSIDRIGIVSLKRYDSVPKPRHFLFQNGEVAGGRVVDRHRTCADRDRDILDPCDAPRGRIDFGGAPGAIHAIDPVAASFQCRGHACRPLHCSQGRYIL